MDVERIVILSRYDRNGASSRVRFMQYIPALERAGFTVEVFPLFEREHLEAIYRGQRPWLASAGQLLRQWRKLRSLRAGDLVWMESEALPWVPWLIETRILRNDQIIVSDYDDAVFHRYDLHRFAFIRWTLGRKIDRVMRRSNAIFVGNDYLRQRAVMAGGRNITHLPTVVDTETYRPSNRRIARDVLTVGWIGTPVTWKKYVAPLVSMLEQALAAGCHRFRAIGVKSEADQVGIITFIPWSEQGEVAEIQELDVGIMPLPDSPWERGKCGYKLIQYMACGLPVIASPVGVNREIVTHGVNGFFAEAPEEWLQALSTLLEDAMLREQMGAEGRRRIEQHYSLHRYTPVVVETFKALRRRP